MNKFFSITTCFLMVSGVLNAQIIASNPSESKSTSTLQNDEVSIYPNPSKRGFINISGFSSIESAETITLEIYNLNGKRICSQEISLNNGTANVGIQDLYEGEYTVRISTAVQSYTSRLIVTD